MAHIPSDPMGHRQDRGKGHHHHPTNPSLGLRGKEGKEFALCFSVLRANPRLHVCVCVSLGNTHTQPTARCSFPPLIPVLMTNSTTLPQNVKHQGKRFFPSKNGSSLHFWPLTLARDARMHACAKKHMYQLSTGTAEGEGKKQPLTPSFPLFPWPPLITFLFSLQNGNKGNRNRKKKDKK